MLKWKLDTDGSIIKELKGDNYTLPPQQQHTSITCITDGVHNWETTAKAIKSFMVCNNYN